jgi:hypothetical protein
LSPCPSGSVGQFGQITTVQSGNAEGFDLLNHHNLFIQQSLNDVSNVGDGVPVPITASKGGIGNNGGANDERRFGQFALKINF